MGDSHKHKRQRKMMNSSFAFEIVPTFVQAGHKFKDIWMIQTGNKKEKIITVSSLIPKITLDVIGLVGFNYESNSITSESELAQAIYLAIILRLDSVFVKHFFRSSKNFQPLITPNIMILLKLSIKFRKDKFRTINTPVIEKDLLSLLLFDILGLYFLAKNPDCQDRLRKEILDVFIDRDHCPTFDEIDQLKYLECVFKETLKTAAPGIVQYLSFN
ncbi:cytochrome P450 [Gigaspora margarita]|uniref:Cytochrome P450 n=1 Tax=Gigaspora margarita TaxID=4874 RepID=A0A8H4EQ31_GIGMA|nr:cytochrome P450 [Gigaspora margarita]